MVYKQDKTSCTLFLGNSVFEKLYKGDGRCEETIGMCKRMKDFDKDAVNEGLLL